MKYYLSIFLIILINSLVGQNKLFYDYEYSTSQLPEITFNGRINNILLSKEEFNNQDFKLNIQDSDSCNYPLLNISELEFTDTLLIHIIIESKKTEFEDINLIFKHFNSLSSEKQNIKIIWYSSYQDSIFSTFKIPELLKAKIKISHWENEFPDFISQLPNVNKHLIIQVIEKENSKIKFETIDLIKNNINERNIVAGLIYLNDKKEKKRNKEKVKLQSVNDIQKYLIFDNCISKSDFIETIDRKITLFLRSNYQLSFTVPYKLNVEYFNSINAVLIVHQDTFTINQEIIYPQSIYKKVYVYRTLINVTKSFNSKRHYDALDTLLVANNQIPNFKFDSLSKIILRNLGEKFIISGSDPYSYFSLAENTWGLTSESISWYKVLKLNILDSFFNSINSKSVNTNKLIATNKDRLELDPENRKYQLTNLKLKASIQEENNQLIKSLGYYHVYLNISREKWVEVKLRKNLSEVIKSSYNNKQYNVAYKTGKEYFGYLKNDFILRYYYAYSCNEVKDYYISIINYEWLINNWDNKQTVVTWDEAFRSIENLYTQTFNFEKAMDLNQRYYRQTTDYPLLNAYLKNVRLSYLKPVIDVIKTHATTAGIDGAIEIYNKDIVDFPHYISNIYSMRNGIIINQFYKDIAITPPSESIIRSNVDYPAIEQQLNDIWFIDKVAANEYIVIELSTKVDIVEQSLLDEITKKKEMAEPWKNLVKYESDQLRYFSSVFISNIIGKDVLDNGVHNLVKYKHLVNDNPLIEYIEIYDQKGEGINSINFNMTYGKFESMPWQKSVVTNAFFKQKIDYNGHDVIDICNPIYRNNIRELVIRIGINED